MANLGDGADIHGISQIIRTCDIHRRRNLIRRRQGSFHVVRANRAGEIRFLHIGRKPENVCIHKRSGAQKGFMSVPTRRHDGSFSPLPGAETRQINHGTDAQGRALRGIKRRTAEQDRSVVLAFPYDSRRLIKAVGARYLGDIQLFHAQRAYALMTGHMQPQGAALGIVPDKIAYGRIHRQFPSNALATCTIIAHSMRFLNSSQPYLYTPRIEPVE